MILLRSPGRRSSITAMLEVTYSAVAAAFLDGCGLSSLQSSIPELCTNTQDQTVKHRGA